MFDLRSLPIPVTRSGRTCMLRVVDRRTGEPARVDGRPLCVFTRDPATAARELMARRNRADWEVRVDPLGTPLV